MIRKLIFQVWVKLFLDADTESMKVSLNVINQEKPNAAEKHLINLYCECPDRKFNLSQIMRFLNTELARFNYKVQCTG